MNRRIRLGDQVFELLPNGNVVEVRRETVRTRGRRWVSARQRPGVVERTYPVDAAMAERVRGAVADIESQTDLLEQ